MCWVDFTPNKAVDKDETSLIAYDKYTGDPSDRLESIRSRKGSMGDKSRFDPDTDDVVGAYVRAAAIREVDAERTAVMERASKSGPALAERAGAPGAGYDASVRARSEQQRSARMADLIEEEAEKYEYQKSLSEEASQLDPVTGPKGYRGKLDFKSDVSLHGLSYKDQAAYLDDYYEGIRKGKVDPNIQVRVSQAGYDRFIREGGSTRMMPDALKSMAGTATPGGLIETTRAQLEKDRFAKAVRTDIDQGLSTLEKSQIERERDARIMATERSNRAAAKERARLADLEVEQNKLVEAGDVLSSSTTSTYEKDSASDLLSRWDPSQFYSAIKDPTASRDSKDLEVDQGWNQIKSNINRINTREYFGIKFGMQHNNKVRRQVQAILTNYRQTYGEQLKDMGRRNSIRVNAEPFKMSGGLFFGAFQALANKLGIAYHATDTELELRALEEKWGVTEKPRSDQTPEEQKFFCERREGWEWDEDAQVCRMKSADRFDEENRFVPQY